MEFIFTFYFSSICSRKMYVYLLFYCFNCLTIIYIFFLFGIFRWGRWDECMGLVQFRRRMTHKDCEDIARVVVSKISICSYIIIIKVLVSLISVQYRLSKQYNCLRISHFRLISVILLF